MAVVAFECLMAEKYEVNLKVPIPQAVVLEHGILEPSFQIKTLYFCIFYCVRGGVLLIPEISANHLCYYPDTSACLIFDANLFSSHASDCPDFASNFFLMRLCTFLIYLVFLIFAVDLNKSCMNVSCLEISPNRLISPLSSISFSYKVSGYGLNEDIFC